MPKKDPARDNMRYEVITQETEDGDILIPIPEVLLERMGWKEGTELNVQIDKDGRIFLSKA